MANNMPLQHNKLQALLYPADKQLHNHAVQMINQQYCTLELTLVHQQRQCSRWKSWWELLAEVQSERTLDTGNTRRVIPVLTTLHTFPESIPSTTRCFPTAE